MYENGIKPLTFGTGEIVLRDGRFVLEHDALPFIEDGEELRFQFFADAGEGERFALGTSKEEHGVYLTKEEYELAVETLVKSTCDAKKEIRECLDEIFKESEILPENFGEEIVAELEKRFLEDGYEITKKNVIEEMLWCYMCRIQ